MQRITNSAIKISNVFAILTFVASCVSHDLENLDDNGGPCAETVGYINEVSPIVMIKCAIEGCHNGDNGADRNWTDFEKFKAHSVTVKNYVRDGVMPPPSSPAGALTAAEVQTISCWVDQGAQNN